MVGAGHPHARPKTFCNRVHAIVICGYSRASEIARLSATLIDVLEHGFRGNLGQDFAGETGGGKARRNHAQYFTRHTRSYHKSPMLDLKKKGWQAMLPSCRKLFVFGAISWASAAGAFAQPPVAISPRASTVPKNEVLPKANIRVDSNLVLIPVTVTDPLNRFVTGLDKENFKILEDKKEQTISQFSSEDAPLSVGVVFDCSGSMGHKLEKSRLAVAQFFKTANPEDEFFLVQFSDSAELVQPFTGNLEEIQNRLTFTQSKGRTALLDAIYLGLHEMKKAKNPRKALLVISDGGDNNSRYTEPEIKNLVKEADVQIYAIGIYEAMSARGRTPGRGRRAGIADRDRRADRRPPVPCGQPERIAGRRRQDRSRIAKPVRSRLCAGQPRPRWEIPARRGQTGAASRDADCFGRSGNRAIMLLLNKPFLTALALASGLAAFALQGQQTKPPATPPQEDTPTIIRADVRLVVCHTTVVDKSGHLVTDLPREAFTVWKTECSSPSRVSSARMFRFRSASSSTTAAACATSGPRWKPPRWVWRGPPTPRTRSSW